MNCGIHALVSGRVQGVNYRRATLVQATKLDIKGWVQNLPDGRVEVTAYGEQTSIQLFIKWLHHGPVLADVSNVQVENIPWQTHAEFEILR